MDTDQKPFDEDEKIDPEDLVCIEDADEDTPPEIREALEEIA